MLKLNRITKIMASFALTVALLGCSQTKKTESTGQIIDDSAITTKVKAAIIEDQALKALQINVKTFKGEVQLSGFVDSAQSVKKAGEVAQAIKDVTSVKNDLVVK
jgi:osmotically-inducible protein OsmY